jgi:hypothetical protein
MPIRRKTAPWDAPRPDGSSTPSEPAVEPPSFELEVELDLGRPARTPRSEPASPGPEAKLRSAAPARASSPPVGRRPPAPELGLAGGELPSYSTEDSISFWALQSVDTGRAAPVAGEPLSGTDEVFDPATGWDFAAVSDADLRASHEQTTPSPAPPPVRSAVANVPDWGSPSFGDEPVSPASSPIEGPSFSDLPAPASASREAPLPDLDTFEPPAALSSDGSIPFEPAPPSCTSGPVVFDPDGFFSVADVSGPTSPPPAGSEAGQLEESAEFEFDIDDEPVSELEEHDIYSQSALPAVPPELAILPVEDAVVRARELFADDDPDLGMAILQAARMRAPNDTRVETWLEFGERRLMARYAPGARPDRVPVLAHPKEKLLRVTAGDQAALIAAIDGQRDLIRLRRALPQLPVVGFWKDVGKLLERGWLGWSD